MVLARFRMPALAVTIGAAALALPLLSLAAPAQAAAGGNGGGRGPAGARASAPSVVNNTTFAGYQASVAPGSATSSAAQFKVPRFSCTAATRGITTGVGVVVKSFRSDSTAFLFAGFYRVRAFYTPALKINGNQVTYATSVRAGDVIKLSAKVTTRGTTVQITDATTGVTKRRTGPGASPITAFVGDNDFLLNGILLGVPKFGTLTFTSCLVDGRALAHSHPARYQRVTRKGILQIATGALSSGGTVFATNYKHF